jgi:hypothetical protein
MTFRLTTPKLSLVLLLGLGVSATGCTPSSSTPTPKSCPGGDIPYSAEMEGRCCSLPSSKKWKRRDVAGVPWLTCATSSSCNYSNP